MSVENLFCGARTTLLLLLLIGIIMPIFTVREKNRCHDSVPAVKLIRDISLVDLIGLPCVDFALEFHVLLR